MGVRARPASGRTGDRGLERLHDQARLARCRHATPERTIGRNRLASRRRADHVWIHRFGRGQIEIKQITATMNSASKDFPRHLNALREKMLHPTDYEAAVYYFLQEFAGDKEFVLASTQEKIPNLVTVLGDVLSKALGKTAKLTDVLVSS